MQNSSRLLGVTKEDIVAFQRDGAVCLRQLLTLEELELLQGEESRSILSIPVRAQKSPAVPQSQVALSKTTFAGRRMNRTDDSYSSRLLAP